LDRAFLPHFAGVLLLLLLCEMRELTVNDYRNAEKNHELMPCPTEYIGGLG
jgi:hypothetical protein